MPEGNKKTFAETNREAIKKADSFDRMDDRANQSYLRENHGGLPGLDEETEPYFPEENERYHGGKPAPLDKIFHS